MHPLSELHPNTQPRGVAPDVASLTLIFVNTYMVGEPRGPWVLIDAGLPMCANRISRAAEEKFGRAPECIVLTHGHFDHAGSALELARLWDVPVFAHRLEMPYLTGKSAYPPGDPTVGGTLAQMSRVFPTSGYDLRGHVHELPPDGSVPGLPEWRWVPTPGHSHGHVSLFRERDRLLLAGDALATVDQDSLFGMILQHPEFHRPPAPFTTDWQAACASVERLAALHPSAVAAGHGQPVTGPETAARLHRFAAALAAPKYGRYAHEPAIADALGVVSVPPPAPDRLRGMITGMAIGAAAGATIFALLRPRDTYSRR